MLQSLHIKNLYLIDELDIEFGEGLNIFTGETGAGKSIIMDSIGLIIGEKAETNVIREGFQKGFVEAIFNISKIPELKSMLEEKGIPIEDNTLIIKREISIDGKNKAFINMSTVILSTLKEVGEYLLDISGQHQHHSLLRVSNHIKLLDSYSKLDTLISEFKSIWNGYLSKKERLNELIEAEKEKERILDMSQFAIDEIEESKLKEGEEQELVEELSFLTNYQKLVNATDICYNNIYEESNSIIPLTEVVINELEKVTHIDNRLIKILEEAREALYKFESVRDFLRGYKDNLEFSPERIEEINERLNLISNLKKKYGGSITKVLEYKNYCFNVIKQIEKNEEEINSLEKELKDMETIISEKALNLSRKRIMSSKELKQRVIQELAYLGMEKAIFEVEFRYIEDQNSFLKIKDKGVKIEENGIDRVEFTISTNPGESPKPLAKIASGGELSRIMLAIKIILINSDNIGTVIFDEVDVGIGGEAAIKVGNKIKEMSKSTMVICITHLPQIASKGDNNYAVEKIQKDERTITIVTKLDNENLIKEIARMLGGNNVSEITLQHAKELISNK